MNRVLFFPSVLLMLMLGGCATGDVPTSAAEQQANLNDAVRYIPSDTTYFVANRRRADPLTTELSWKAMTPMLRQLQWVITTLLNNQEEPSEYASLMRMLDGNLNREGFASWGIGDLSNSVLYGYQLYPVLRIEIADRQQVEATLGKMLAEAGDLHEVLEHRGHSYHRLSIPDDDELLQDGDSALDPDADLEAEVDSDASRATSRGVFAHLSLLTREDELIVAFHDPKADDLVLDHITRSVPLVANLLNSGRIEQINRSMGYRDESATTEVDIQALATRVMARIEADEGEVSAASCRLEAEQLFGIMPKFLAGTTLLGEDRFVQSGMIRVRPDLAASLPGLVRALPFQNLEDPGFFSLGIGFDVVAIRDYLLERSAAVLESPYQCQGFAGLNEAAASMQASLSQPLPPFLSSVFGMHLSIDDLQFNANGLDALEGALMVAIDNAPFLMAMMQTLVPELAEIDLQPHAPPVAIPAGVLPFEADRPMMAMSDQALVVSLGESGARRIDAYRSDAVESSGPSAAALMTFAVTSGAADLFSSLDVDQLTDYFSETGNRFPDLYDWMSIQRTQVNLLHNGVQMVIETELASP